MLLRLSDGRLMDDRIGYQPLLIVDGEGGNPPVTEGLEVIATDDEPLLKPALAERDAIAVSIRPDRYGLGRARRKEDLGRLIDEIRHSSLKSPPIGSSR